MNFSKNLFEIEYFKIKINKLVANQAVIIYLK